VRDKCDNAPDLRWFILRAKEQKNRVGVYINALSLALLMYLLNDVNMFDSNTISVLLSYINSRVKTR
jgi:hypothetical protein